ncbi:MAG: hypothetical protein M1325_02800 [Actinobacteria bacterium]|nr:hypothetical protein [Actinomycetota bacterium]
MRLRPFVHGGGHRAAERADRGVVLMEVVVAAGLLLILIVPLVQGMLSLRDASLHLDAQAAAGAGGVGGNDRWWWGAPVVADCTVSGRSLRVVADAGGRATPLSVGFWADGWLVGEVNATGAEELLWPIPSDLWTQGGEVTVRVRRPHGAWGVPWRIALAPGGVPTQTAPGAAGSDGGGACPASGLVIVHLPAGGVGTVEITAASQVTEVRTFRGPAVGTPPAGNQFETRYAGRSQSGVVWEGGVHVYY